VVPKATTRAETQAGTPRPFEVIAPEAGCPRGTGPLDGDHCWPPLAFRPSRKRSSGALPADIEPGVLSVPRDELSSTSGRRWARLPVRHPEGCRSFGAMPGSVHRREPADCGLSTLLGLHRPPGRPDLWSSRCRDVFRFEPRRVEAGPLRWPIVRRRRWFPCGSGAQRATPLVPAPCSNVRGRSCLEQAPGA
jgi:hypothetical protein